MGKLFRLALSSALLSTTLLFALGTQASVIDFEEFLDRVPVAADSIETQGYNLSFIGGGNYALAYLSPWPDNAIALFFCPNCAASEGFTLSRTSGTSFAIDSFQTSFGFNLPGTLTVTGLRDDNSTISLVLDNLTDSMQTIDLSTEWANLQSVTFEAVNTSDHPFNTIGFDNIAVTTVPVPAAAWLFGSGLIGLAGLSRRKRRLAA